MVCGQSDNHLTSSFGQVSHDVLHKLVNIRAAKVQGLVGAEFSFEEFKVVSGVPAIAAAIAQLNARLAARGARPQLRVMTHCS